MNTHWLLVRADFALTGGGERVMLKRWRRVLSATLADLLGHEGKVRVRLHDTGSFTAWLKIAVDRRPTRKRVRAREGRLRAKLAAALLPVRGLVFDLTIRRFRGKPELALVGLPEPMPAIFSLEEAGHRDRLGLYSEPDA